MRTLFVVIAAVLSFAGAARAQTPVVCDVPGYLLLSESELKRAAAAVKERRALDIVVIGTGSSVLAGPNSATVSYPARLEQALRRRLPGISVNVVSEAKPRQTAADMAKGFQKIIRDLHPVLVIWQSGTVEAMRGINPDDFRTTLDEGVDMLRAGGADVILMNMQYSPRTESMMTLEPYGDTMRVVSREREVPLFDRLSIMRYWNDSGAFDLNTSHKDTTVPQQVHECLGRSLATLVIDTAHLNAIDTKASQ